MDRMFDKAHVTGNTSAIPGEPTQEDQTVVDIDCSEDGEEDVAADGGNNEVICTLRSVGQIILILAQRRTRKIPSLGISSAWWTLWQKVLFRVVHP